MFTNIYISWLIHHFHDACAWYSIISFNGHNMFISKTETITSKIMDVIHTKQRQLNKNTITINSNNYDIVIWYNYDHLTKYYHIVIYIKVFIKIYPFIPHLKLVFISMRTSSIPLTLWLSYCKITMYNQCISILNMSLNFF